MYHKSVRNEINDVSEINQMTRVNTKIVALLSMAIISYLRRVHKSTDTTHNALN